MRRLVSPLTWSTLNAVEHPPLMMKQLVQGVCGGLRWLEAKELAEFIIKKATNEGYYGKGNKKRGSALSRKKSASTGVLPGDGFGNRGNLSKKLSKRTGDGEQSNSTALDHFRGVATLPVDALIPIKRERLVQYDVLDCTLGGGYHSGAVLENGAPYTRVVALDCDPDMAKTAKDLAREFGSQRIRFFNSKMSHIKSMFGEKSFDAVMIDSGPSNEQLEDPTRGFLLQEENDHRLDMRYGPDTGLDALHYLNTVPQKTLASSLAEYKLLTPEQSMKFSRIIRKHRPFRGSIDFFDRIEFVETDTPLDSWASQSSRRKAPMPWEFLTSLRCLINDEKRELREGVEQALLVLRDNGRLVVFTRLAWEEELVQGIIQGHPHGILVYSEEVGRDDVGKYGHSRHTKMWVAQKVKGSAFVTKNSIAKVREEEVKESQLRWMTGLYAGQTHGFPANHITFENLEPEERATLKRNAQPPPFDYDEDPRSR